MKEVYLVMQSKGEYEDYREWNTGTVFLSLFSAEKVKQEIIDYNSTEEPFPFDYCTEEEFTALLYEDKIVEEEIAIYDRWAVTKYNKYEFNNCWIQTLILEE